MLSTVEKLLARLGSGIESTAGVCGGDPRIAGTRIPVWTLEQYRRLGLTEAQILGSFPALRATDLASAWSFVAEHPDEIDRQNGDGNGDRYYEGGQVSNVSRCC
jgi:uncharacterized protein (DUF433 family)